MCSELIERYSIEPCAGPPGHILWQENHRFVRKKAAGSDIQSVLSLCCNVCMEQSKLMISYITASHYIRTPVDVCFFGVLLVL